jgi:hypothetical protein
MLWLRFFSIGRVVFPVSLQIAIHQPAETSSLTDGPSAFVSILSLVFNSGLRVFVGHLSAAPPAGDLALLVVDRQRAVKNEAATTGKTAHIPRLFAVRDQLELEALQPFHRSIHYTLEHQCLLPFGEGLTDNSAGPKTQAGDAPTALSFPALKGRACRAKQVTPANANGVGGPRARQSRPGRN